MPDFDLTPAQKRFWCSHTKTVQDDDGHRLCTDCGASFYDGLLRYEELENFANRVMDPSGETKPFTEHQLEKQLNPDTNHDTKGRS